MLEFIEAICEVLMTLTWFLNLQVCLENVFGNSALVSCWITLLQTYSISDYMKGKMFLLLVQQCFSFSCCTILHVIIVRGQYLHLVYGGGGGESSMGRTNPI
jgi:hypothetical protein